jgi:hypothetical protein
MSDAQLEVYHHSGRRAQRRDVFVPLGGIAAALVLGLVYAYATVYSPTILLSIVLVLIHAMLLGAWLAHVAVQARCRNTKFVKRIAMPVAMFAVYAQWVFFIYAFDGRETVHRSLTTLLARPGAVWKWINTINDTGWYSFLGWTPTGVFLWLFWLIESGVIILFTVAIPWDTLSRRVYCERCGDWCPMARKRGRESFSGTQTVRKRLPSPFFLTPSSYRFRPSSAQFWPARPPARSYRCPTRAGSRAPP